MIFFGLTVSALVVSFYFHKRIIAEPSWEKKLYLGGLMMPFSKLAHYNVAMLLITGIINMANRYGGFSVPWPMEHWLLTKIILFLIVSFNGLYVAKRMGMKRAMLIKSVVEGKGPADAEEQLQKQNAGLTRLFYVQITILTLIILLSAFFSGKHPFVVF